MPLHTAQPAPSREADSWPAGQEIDRLLGTITSIAVFSDLNSQPAFSCSVPLRSTLTLSFHLCLVLASALLIIIMYPFLLPPSVLHILQSRLTFAQLLNKISGNLYSPIAHCYVFKSIDCYPEPDESSLRYPVVFQVCFNIILSYTSKSSK